jgi:hypothetical protein
MKTPSAIAPANPESTDLPTFGSDSDLRPHGERIASRGGKNAKKRAVVAVGRKLCVLLHRLWVTGEVYDPLYNTHRRQEPDQIPIHRSAWNRNSAKYVPQQQRRFLTGLRCLRYSLCA